ncbi:MAG: PH domain-containing protein [Clostridia bacterium]|jgi:uncharacterized membrane protein YdbT with pleckstrin-like domain|nr:PH domain-containing protein [Clostridia bacterium]
MAETPLWAGRKHNFLGLPWTFTTYRLTDTCLFIKSGVFNVKEDEIRLYRILDITLKRSFGERILGLGSIHLCSSDKSTPEITIKRIRHAKEVRTILSDRVEEERSAKLNGMQEIFDEGRRTHPPEYDA